MTSRTMVAGNWKMNTTPTQGKALAEDIIAAAGTPPTKVVFGVPAIQLMSIKEITAQHEGYFVAAQNMHHKDNGAYTGELSAAMLADAGVDYVILGHSERREYFGENDSLVNIKINKALNAGLLPIYCCGEKLDIREAGNHEMIVGKQIEQALFSLDPAQMEKVVIAYEPVWAIGTGVTASPEQAQEMHSFIRQMVANQFGDTIANSTTILYGGSVKPDNAEELFGMEDVDGGLVGGASLSVENFVPIIKAR
ncbi:triose-phosphate isomerase [Neolewinella persica]|uniref:triose-phosphate isomerase n=1 Tax=Neolewinella persica TaxID=70998 RepID=UPI0004781820|nr:triose-phosphate isomerase [Neolewinella persica]